jgi:phosphomannomutase
LAKVFGTAGVRGVFNKTQTPTQIYKFAETVAFVFGRGTFAVGWDGRKSSALLGRGILSAVNSTGSDAAVFGVVPTPVLAFGTRERGHQIGFSVTASHNPPEFSGVKVFGQNGMELSESDELRIERVSAVNPQKSSGVFGDVEWDLDVLRRYVDALTSRYGQAKSKLRIAVDCATGPGGSVTPRVLTALGHEVVPVNAQISWRFPARNPEPTPENLNEFAQIVPSLGVDFGFAHDGDADRLVMVDSLGRLVPDSLCSIIALHGIAANSGTVVLSENTSSAVEEEAKGMGYRVVRSRVGKTFASLEKENGVFATEPSKITDPSWGLWEDGMNAAALICDTVSKDRAFLERVFSESRWHYRQVNLGVGVDMEALLGKAREAFRKYKIQEERRIDGCKFVFADDSWIMFRSSGTEPKSRIYCESKDPDELHLLVQEAIKCIEALVYNPPRPN